MVKLTNEEIKWLIIRLGSGFFTVQKAAAVYGVTERRVQQLIKMHRETGGVPTVESKEKTEDVLEYRTEGGDQEGLERDALWRPPPLLRTPTARPARTAQ